jgi:pantoate--beta-alanine ligase
VSKTTKKASFSVQNRAKNVQELLQNARKRGLSVGFVPTMGALHAGHCSLIESAKSRCDWVVVSVFVNPTQFAAGEDLDRYPRQLERDVELCRAMGVDVVFAPDVAEMYADDAATTVRVGGLTERLCGAFRPGHFDGVTTVVCKLFQIVPADVAFFGEKDYQQLMVIKRMVRDLLLPVEIVGCPTVRERDGLAHSSRNALLSAVVRSRAVALYESLVESSRVVAAGERRAATIVDRARAHISASHPSRIDYISVVDACTLEDVERIDGPTRLCVAVVYGGCRLIDNVALGAPVGTG